MQQAARQGHEKKYIFRCFEAAAAAAAVLLNSLLHVLIWELLGSYFNFLNRPLRFFCDSLNRIESERAYRADPFLQSSSSSLYPINFSFRFFCNFEICRAQKKNYFIIRTLGAKRSDVVFSLSKNQSIHFLFYRRSLFLRNFALYRASNIVLSPSTKFSFQEIFPAIPTF